MHPNVWRFPKFWVFKEFCGTNPVSPVKLRWRQRGFANATPDMLCAQCQRAICAKHPWAALESAARPRIETGRRSRYGGAKDMRSLLRSVSGASLIRIGVSAKNLEEPISSRQVMGKGLTCDPRLPFPQRDSCLCRREKPAPRRARFLSLQVNRGQRSKSTANLTSSQPRT